MKKLAFSLSIAFLLATPGCVSPVDAEVAKNMGVLRDDLHTHQTRFNRLIDGEKVGQQDLLHWKIHFSATVQLGDKFHAWTEKNKE